MWLPLKDLESNWATIKSTVLFPNEQWIKTCRLGYIGDYTTQLYGDYMINHNKDPYKTTSKMESKSFFFRGSDDALRDPFLPPSTHPSQSHHKKSLEIPTNLTTYKTYKRNTKDTPPSTQKISLPKRASAEARASLAFKFSRGLG